MKNISFFYLFIIILTGCTSAIYMVSVVDSSPKPEPMWLTNQPENEIIGFGENKFKKTAYDEAIKDLQMRIASEIGIEVEFQSSDEKRESNDGFSETTKLDLDIIGDAILREIHSNVSGIYWEHCRAQTGKKKFNDFYRYYVKANIPPDMIDTLRSMTIAENNKRFAVFKEELAQVDSELYGKNAFYPVDMLREYIDILDIANSLFYDKNQHIRTCMNRISDIVSELRISLKTPYSEVRPTTHYMEFEVHYKFKPVEGVKVGFQLTRGKGSVTTSSYSDSDGIVRCDVYNIGMSRSNQVVTYLDLADPIEQIDQYKSTIIELCMNGIIRTLHGKANTANFSSQAQKAIVNGGSLELKYVKLGFNGLFRRIDDMECCFYLEETNGRSVDFYNYDVKVTCWIQPLLSNMYYDSREGSFGISPKLTLTYNSRKNFNLPDSKSIANLINEIKTAHEMGMKYVTIEMKLYGTDDAGNTLSQSLKTDRIPWKNLFEK